MKKYILDKEKFDILKNQKDTFVINYDFKLEFNFIDNNNRKIKINIKDIFKYIDDKKQVIFVFKGINNNVELRNIDKIICNIKKISKYLQRKNINAYIYLENSNSKYTSFLEASVLLINIEDKKEKIKFLYDWICDYLDDITIKNNVCGFENDKCFAKKDTNCTMGCCHHFKNRYFGVLYEKKLQLCEYQKNKKCQAKCITCKMYMCKEVKKKGYNFTCNNVLLIKRYFNPLQKIIIMKSFFTPKEKIIKKLLFCQL